MSVDANIYISLWNKYKPVIIQLMKASHNVAQQYQLSGYEFRGLGDRNKSGYSFSLRAFQAKAENDISGSAVARDLLIVLQQSKTAKALLDAAAYEFKLDSKFMLHIKKT